jgi:tetratricopeptide (TPR) repeat protein
VTVLSALHGDTLLTESVEIHPLSGPITLRMPVQRRARPVSGVVSVREMQNPIPKDAWKAFVKAQHYADTAKPDAAIEHLRRALAIYPGWRDAHVNLGTQLYRAGHAEEGLQEFQAAIRIGPPAAIAYTNAAAALAQLHRLEEAEQMVREALRVDRLFARAHYLLGHMLASQRGKSAEALDHLRTAESQVPIARLIAAQILTSRGDRVAAAAELQAYLKSGERTYRERAKELLQSLR